MHFSEHKDRSLLCHRFHTYDLFRYPHPATCACAWPPSVQSNSVFRVSCVANWPLRLGARTRLPSLRCGCTVHTKAPRTRLVVLEHWVAVHIAQIWWYTNSLSVCLFVYRQICAMCTATQCSRTTKRVRGALGTSGSVESNHVSGLGGSNQVPLFWGLWIDSNPIFQIVQINCWWFT